MSNWMYDFTDDFNREELGQDWTIESGDVSIENNTLKCRSVASRERAWVSLNETYHLEHIAFDWYSDHQANAGSDMRFKFLVEGELDVEASWSQFGYQIQWEVWQSAANFPVRLYRVNGATATAIGEFELPLAEGRNTWHKMEVVITESTIYVYHNDELKISAEDNTYRGKKGFILGGREVFDRTVYYDNLTINKREAPLEVDKSALQSAVDEAYLLEEEDYTEASWSGFALALSEAELVLSDEEATQEAVDTAFSQLMSAKEALEEAPIEVDKSALQSAVNEAYLLEEEDYTEASWSVFALALSVAEGVLSDEEATQEAVDTTLNQLMSAINGLVIIPINPDQGLGQRIGIKFTEKITSLGQGKPEAFTLTGEEYQYVKGPVIPVSYVVESVTYHPNDPDQKSLLITLHPQSRFHNILGNLTLSYDSSIGALRGRGGGVEGFSVTFYPIGLEPKPNPGIEESIAIRGKTILDLIQVAYKQAYASEEETTIRINAQASVDFIHIDTVNP